MTREERNEAIDGIWDQLSELRWESRGKADAGLDRQVNALFDDLRELEDMEPDSFEPVRQRTVRPLRKRVTLAGNPSATVGGLTETVKSHTLIRLESEHEQD